jgi:hypothetical protein
MVIVWMKFKCERWFVVELPLLRQHFLQFSSVIARVLLGAQIIGKLFFLAFSRTSHGTGRTSPTGGGGGSGRAGASQIETMHCNFQSASGNAEGSVKFQKLISRCESL